MGSDISDTLRSEVAGRADHRCEYCLIHEEDTGFRLQIDHIVSRKHHGRSSLENLAYSCVLCNRSKGSDVASVALQGGNIVRLYHPRRDRWYEHFQLEGNLIRALSDVGAATVELLRFNAVERVAERTLLQAVGRYPTKV